MSIITRHEITLSYDDKLKLIPLLDKHLPLLYKWNSDPEILYWTEGEEGLSYDEKTVNMIYGGVSKNALCFLIEYEDMPVGECWLQKMNLPHIVDMYTDQKVSRIDIMIGEKAYWSMGIGTAAIALLTDFAFDKQNIDVLHCICNYDNSRSINIIIKNGFQFRFQDPKTTQNHYSLERKQYQNRKTTTN